MAGDYEVGYRKPPKKTRFNPGQSGNPRDRPKGSPNLATDLSAELGELITVREGGQARRVSKQPALLALYARVISEPPEDMNGPVEEDELLILRRFGPRFLKSLAKKEAAK